MPYRTNTRLPGGIADADPAALANVLRRLSVDKESGQVYFPELDEDGLDAIRVAGDSASKHVRWAVVGLLIAVVALVAIPLCMLDYIAMRRLRKRYPFLAAPWLQLPGRSLDAAQRLAARDSRVAAVMKFYQTRGGVVIFGVIMPVLIVGAVAIGVATAFGDGGEHRGAPRTPVATARATAVPDGRMTTHSLGTSSTHSR